MGTHVAQSVPRTCTKERRRRHRRSDRNRPALARHPPGRYDPGPGTVGRPEDRACETHTIPDIPDEPVTLPLARPAAAEQPWELISRRPAGGGAPDTLYLHVFDWHASGKVVVYGLATDVKRAYLLADPQRTELKVEKTGRDVIVEAGAKNAKPPDP